MSTTIVSSWQQLLDADADRSTTDIKFADGGGIIDFNDIQRTGFDTTVVFNKPIDFNNWEFRNIYFKQSGNFYFGATIQNVNFLNVYSVRTGSGNGTFTFKNANNHNITISGLFVQPSSYILFLQSSSNTTTLYDSSFKFDVIDDLKLCKNLNSDKRIVDNCRFDLNCVTSKSSFSINVDATSAASTYTNCLFSGSVYGPNISSSSSVGALLQSDKQNSFNIIDIRNRYPNNSPVILLGTNYSGGLNIYTSDGGIDYHVSGTQNYIVGVTTQQLSQPDYLFDLGFPIGVGAT